MKAFIAANAMLKDLNGENPLIGLAFPNFGCQTFLAEL